MIIKINNIEYQYDDNTTYYTIAQKHQHNYNLDILLVKANGILRELCDTAQNNETIEFIFYNDDEGRNSYIKTVLALFFKAINKVKISNNIISSLKFTQNKGYYISPNDGSSYTKEEIDDIVSQVNNYIERKIEIKKLELSTTTAMALLKKYDIRDKEYLVKFSLNDVQKCFNISGYYGLSRSYYLYDTSYIKKFSVLQYGNGFFISFPTKEDFNIIKDFKPFPKVFKIQTESIKWLFDVNLNSAGFLNEKIAKNQFHNVIILQEALHQKNIIDIANQIKESHKKLIFIAGPSSSGKTTFSYRLAFYLQTLGLNAHQISVDNFFISREECKKDENGEYNFENIDCVDIVELNKVLNLLLSGKNVEMPKYDFILGQRYYDNDYIELKDNDILIMEGIHCLNDKLTKDINNLDKFKICISPFTQISIDYENRIPTSDLRLIRRIVRDNLTRGFKAKDTIKMWSKVRKGEEDNIFPFQEDANILFNSSLCYELSILKMYAEPLLFDIDKNSKEYTIAQRLLRYLSYFLCGNEYAIPKYSLIKEFIGDSVFNVK